MDALFTDFVCVLSIFLENSLFDKGTELDASDYGNQSAGGNFAGFVMLIILLVLCLLAINVAVSVKPGNYRKFEKIQLVSGIVFGIVNVITVVILEMQFPSYQAVMQYINS